MMLALFLNEGRLYLEKPIGSPAFLMGPIMKTTIATAGKRMLSVDAGIGALFNKPVGSVTEQDLKKSLEKFNLVEGLITIGQISISMFTKGKESGQIWYEDSETRIIVAQFTLAYLANILIISGASDGKSQYLSYDDILALCNVYNDLLIQPELAKEYSSFTDDDVMSLFLRMHFAQVENFQFNVVFQIARTIILFRDIVKRMPPERIEDLHVVFERETGLNLTDYLYLAMPIGAGSQKGVNFNTSRFAKTNIPKLKEAFEKDKVAKFINILKADYKTFQEMDVLINNDLDPVFTKNKFNPLSVYPVIETDSRLLRDPFVIPNTIAFLKKSYGGLFWWFHAFFEVKKLQNEFRTYFGPIFQEYVGIILKQIYGEKNVRPEIDYPKGKFMDWIISKPKKFYLIETKAAQFPLQVKKTAEIQLVEEEIRKKVVEAIKQVYKRIIDISKYEVLKEFENKKIVPIIVFMDIPFSSTNFYFKKIENELAKIEVDEELPGLKDLEVITLSIEELEFFSAVSSQIEIEEVFHRYKDDMRAGFMSVIRKVKNGPLRNDFLDKAFCDFWGVPEIMEESET